ASTIARPYAQAIFELAKDSKKLSEWSRQLNALSAIAGDSQINALITNPGVESGQLSELVISVAADNLDQEGKNLVRVLAENGRLNVIREIAGIFEDLKNEAEKTVQAEVLSAFALDKDQISKLRTALKKRLGCEVQITSHVDKSIIGGAIIRAGDMIIDGSVTAQLDRLSGELSH
ncbi:MAG TPA: F0F1 ATP synthase subunit delta, partial [Gammaproteobacteria bacterium]|nr:F0F1 ATP synthase subunit delta [Gammaproteobacteria bacterium]